MSSDPQELGKGLFGYRKSAVNQIIADRDVMLRQAEGRVRAAESKVADLETELGSMRDRNARMDEQLERLRQQLDALAKGAATAVAQGERPSEVGQPDVPAWEEQPATPAAVAPDPAYGEEEPSVAEHEWPRVEGEWPPVDEPAPVLEAEEVESTPGTSADEDFSYGVEVRLGEDAVAEASEATTWAHAETAAAEDQAEHDEAAVGADGYVYEDYHSPEEGHVYGAYGSDSNEEEGAAAEEAPSPFSRFPFTSEPFHQEQAEAAPVAEEEPYADEPVAHVPVLESQAPAEAPPSVHAPEPPAAAGPERVSPVSPETSDITNRFLTEELAGVLAAAEESAARIVERARTTTQRQIARSNRVWGEVQAEVSRFASWRQEVEPVIRAVQSKVESVRAEIEEVPERIRQALAPMADSISSIDGDLADLAAACNPPLLLTPGGLESEESDGDTWGLDPGEDEDFETRGESPEDAFDGSYGGPSDESYGSSFAESKGDQGSGHLHAG
jgi:predicted  nucleic acid-binding Zn-ribbon protein